MSYSVTFLFVSMLMGSLLTLDQVAVAAPARPEICDRLEKASAKGTPAQRLKKFTDDEWAYRMREYPEWATFVGFPGVHDRWTDLSLSAITTRDQAQKCLRQVLTRIPKEKLNAEERLNFDLLLREIDLSIEGQKFDEHYLILNHMDGLHIELADILSSMPRSTVEDYDAIFRRMERLPAHENEMEVLLREGLRRQVTPVKMFLQKIPAQFDKILTPQIEKSPLFEAFQEINSQIPEAQQKQIREKAQIAMKAHVYPALQKLKDFLTKEYIPQSREDISWSGMPNGKAWYAYLAKSHTTTSLSPQQLHDIGLREIERIRQEMEKVRQEVKFKGDVKAFHEFLRKDSKFYFTTAKDLMTAYRDIAKQIDPQLTRLFGKLPRLTYGVKEMPAYKAAEAPTAYYQPGSPQSGRPGYFEANSYDLKARPIWGMEVLTMHEAVPGHHLQIALAQEVEGLPDFRRHDGPTAFVEGWGLYSESLGAELGFYKDPYSKYGQLVYEMWRAIRLVVDTGMHDLGWSREKAITYFMDLMPKSRLETEVEVDRYITMPGQALAYKVGQLKFRELREKAQTALGKRFDPRSFHDEVLRHGAIPMDVLEGLFENWLRAQKTSKKSS